MTVEAVDDRGSIVPDASMEVDFALRGPGEIAAVCSGSPMDTSSFQVPIRRLFRGRALAVIRPKFGSSSVRGGEIELQAKAAGLKDARVRVRSVAF